MDKTHSVVKQFSIDEWNVSIVAVGNEYHVQLLNTRTLFEDTIGLGRVEKPFTSAALAEKAARERLSGKAQGATRLGGGVGGAA